MTIKIAIIGDPFIPSKTFKLSLEKHIKLIRPKISIKFFFKDLKEKNLKPLISKEVSEAFGNQNDVIKIAKNANVLITTFAPITEYVLENCKNLLIVACGRGGPINVNITASTKKNVMVLYAPGRNIDAVVEYTLANIINLVRKIPQAIDYVKKNKWKTPLEDTFIKPSGFEIHKKTIGVIGYGAIGKKLTRVLEALGSNVLIYEPYKKQLDKIGKKNNSSLENIFKNADIITIHARINKNGKPLISIKDFNKMKKKPYIINTSRSQCVESKSLIKAYKMKKIKGFYLDVFDKEPISSNSELYKTINDNIVLTPHAAGVSRDIPSKTAEIIAEEIKKILQSQTPRFVTNPKVVSVVKKNIKKLL
jgi:D-3-phosphoglycerate dehydrogenase